MTHSTSDTAFVRTSLIAAEKAPANASGKILWIRKNLFATVGDSILTILAVLLLLWALPPMMKWLFIDAAWVGTDRSFCATVEQGGIQPNDWSGACWAMIIEKFRYFMMGTYTLEEQWRPILVFILFILLLIPLLVPKAPYKSWNAIAFFGVFPIVSFILLLGGVPGLPFVETSLWGGLMVTLILSFVSISVSLPIGIILALGRRSKLPIIKMFCVGFIELIRGVPLITVLFMASVMLQLFMPPGTSIDKFLRALVGVSIFASAYMAEVIRGGLQAVPKGQSEGADSLGLGYWQKMGLVVMPQALKLVIPSIVNTFISLFKDTSLVSIISMFDLLGIVRASFADSAWISPVTPMTGLVFAGFIFWIFCFGMSRYSAFVERRLDKNHNK
jgi:general L-amino acid transport system permease protein